MERKVALVFTEKIRLMMPPHIENILTTKVLNDIP